MSALPSATMKRILVVDDDEAIQTLMGAVFRPFDCIVDRALEGAGAISMLRRLPYDAVILDLMLPTTNGFEVIREMKSCDPALLQRTIVMTAAANATLRDFEDATLVRKVFRKPFDLAEFVKEVLSCASAATYRRSASL